MNQTNRERETHTRIKTTTGTLPLSYIILYLLFVAIVNIIMMKKKCDYYTTVLFDLLAFVRGERIRIPNEGKV